ncbi:Nitrogen permease regulator 3 [Ceratocystis pirilliformis]|uniref:Nitrogen permease regulator 3 n=1 Tax=Ceratocystis pirilliformis TaxID=259994 RepID=A0ABR3ZG53_9PEZI
MSFPVLPNTSTLIAVALVMNRSHDDGPSFVFHYPPKVSPFDDNEEKATPDDLIIERLSQPEEEALGIAGYQKSTSLQWSRDDVLQPGNADSMPWETFVGLPTRDLASILTPKRSFHKKLFHLSLDPIHCIACPMHVPEGGIWRRTRKKKNKGKSVASTNATNMTNKKEREKEKEESVSPKTTVENAQSVPVARLDEAVSKLRGTIVTDDDDEEDSQAELGETGGGHDEEAGENQAEQTARDSEHHEPVKKKDKEKDAEKEKEKEKDRPQRKPSPMTMFNLVFFLNPKKHETNELVENIYRHVLKKTTRIFKYSQQQSDFVWKESKRILATKDKGREMKASMNDLWLEIMRTSSLAAAIRELYTAVSNNRIATLQLETAGGTLSPSVQIPFPNSISQLPAEGAIQQQGIWLTTAHMTISDDNNSDEPEMVDRTFGLLLLGSDKKIIAELESDPDPTTVAMVEFVRLASQPNNTFQQMADTHKLTLSQVRKFASHFIFWRRGIAIPPLFARDVYIASPNLCPSRLPRASQEWQRQFPMALPLPVFLSEISTAPRQWKYWSPAKAQRPEYMKMLAWLMRGGWVTQLCTFAYVVVWPEIIYEVRYAHEAAKLRTARELYERSEAAANASSPSTSASSSPLSSSPDQSRGSGFHHYSHSHHPPGSGGLGDISPGPVSPTIERRPQIGRPIKGAAAAVVAASISRAASHHSAASSATALARSNHSTMADQIAEHARLARQAAAAKRKAAEKQTAHARKTPPMATPHPSTNNAPHLACIEPHIILDPRRATGNEAEYLDAIKARFASETTADSWQRFAKYFNGQYALERISLQEGMRRKDVFNRIGEMGEYLLCVRHW